MSDNPITPQEWQDIATMPWQTVCEVRNPQMEEPCLATRGYVYNGMVHPDDTFCTTVFTPDPDGLFPTTSGQLVCPIFQKNTSAIDGGLIHTSPADAEFIVRAVNSHDELVEVLERLIELDTDGEAGCRVDPLEYGEALNNARTALSHARSTDGDER